MQEAEAERLQHHQNRGDRKYPVLKKMPGIQINGGVIYTRAFGKLKLLPITLFWLRPPTLHQ